MTDYDESIYAQLSAINRHASDFALGIARARESAWLTGPIRTALEEFNRGRELRLGLLNNIPPSEYETIRRATEEHERFMAKLNGSGLLGTLTGVSKLHDPYEGMALETARRIHYEMERTQRGMMGLAGSVHQARLLAEQRDMLAVADRNARWANHLLVHQSDLDQLLGVPVGSLGDVIAGAKAIAAQTDGIARTMEVQRATTAAEARIQDTIARMAGFAGSLAMTGPSSLATTASATALLGRWETLPHLPASYYRDREVRTRLYREAEVDPFVVEADRGELIEVMVESGLVEGDRTRSGNTAALIRIGSTPVRITAAKPTVGAFELIDQVDRAMKRLVDVIMTDRNGEDWLSKRLRSQPEALERLEQKVRAAVRAGEPEYRLVYYLDLGELLHIVNDGKNWSLFAPVFTDRIIFEADMRRLNCIRRPVVHGRGIDQVRLLEVVTVSDRLISAIERTGGSAA
jgi:hypothetical protein